MTDVANSAAGQNPATATLNYPGGTAEFPITPAVQGSSSIDLSTLTRQTGLTGLDYGFVNTASTRSQITYIDGEQGILRYRGYPIEQLAEHSTYLEVAWLLIYGELPTADQLADFDDKVRRHTLLHEDLKRFFSALPHTAHPMSVLSSAVAALSTYYEGSSDPHDPDHVEVTTLRLLAKLPVIAAYAHKKSVGQAFLYPDNSLNFVENFLRLNFGNMAEPYVLERPSCAPSTACSSSTRTTSRTPRPRRCDSSARPVRTSTPRSRPASRHSRVPCTAARTRPCCRCSPASRSRARASRSSSSA